MGEIEFAEPTAAARAAIIDEIERRAKIMREALRAIAGGKARAAIVKGMPLDRYESQRIARQALVEAGERW